ncbi:MAG TPA: DUF456 domain-containing protein [Bacteroidales bacterium]|nr:DUF456 domain-containing protein [Bacteroidales bacterium]
MPETLLLVIAIVLLILGLLGSFLPVLPGPPLSFAGMLLIHFSPDYSFPTFQLVLFGLLAVFIIVIDFLLPVYGTKKTGGSKRGMYGASIGLVLGIFLFPPIGIFVMPFIGALIAELSNKKDFAQAFKAATGSFLGLLAGTFLKLSYSIAIIVVCLILIL